MSLNPGGYDHSSSYHQVQGGYSPQSISKGFPPLGGLGLQPGFQGLPPMPSFLIRHRPVRSKDKRKRSHNRFKGHFPQGRKGGYIPPRFGRFNRRGGDYIPSTLSRKGFFRFTLSIGYGAGGGTGAGASTVPPGRFPSTASRISSMTSWGSSWTSSRTASNTS